MREIPFGLHRTPLTGREDHPNPFLSLCQDCLHNSLNGLVRSFSVPDLWVNKRLERTQCIQTLVCDHVSAGDGFLAAALGCLRWWVHQ